jgi:hypothetical protein
MGYPTKGYITCRCTFKCKQTSTLGNRQNIPKSLLYESTILMSNSYSKSEITNETHEVNIRSINSEVALSQCYI